MLRAPLDCFGTVVLAGLVVACTTPHHAGKVPKESPRTSARRRAAVAGRYRRGGPESLLHEYEGREVASAAEIATWQLPFQAKRIAVALLTLAAKDDLAGLPAVFTRHARWGIPDRREYDARPIFADGGREFFDVFRDAASRFARKEAFFCPPVVPPAAQIYVRNGAEPMWCAYLSRDGLDVLAFKFVYENGSAKIDYIGLLPTRAPDPVRPQEPQPQPQPPPMTPQVKRGTGPVGPFMSSGGETVPLQIERRPPPGTVNPPNPAGSSPRRRPARPRPPAARPPARPALRRPRARPRLRRRPPPRRPREGPRAGPDECPRAGPRALTVRACLIKHALEAMV
ncbi:hypothetical protein [Nannocystis pusilla]|uniref:hypothetical protein n=1 Tax=Nannocystis pusilla TaxID=889268 RepID=UPI003B7CA62F